MSEQMTAKERMIITAKGGVADRIPVTPDFSVMIPTRLTGLDWWDVHYYEKISLWKAYIDAVDYFGIDGWFVYGAPEYRCSNGITVSEEKKAEFSNGTLKVQSTFHTPEGDLTQLTEFFKNDVSVMPERVIKDFKKDFKALLHLFPEYDDCDYTLMKEQQKAFSDRGLFCVNIGTPGFHVFNDYFANLQECTYAYYDEPELFMELVKQYEKHVMSKLKVAIEGGVDCIMTGGSGSITLQSPDLWRELSLPTIQKITKMCKEADVLSGIHSCGKETYLIKACAEETELNFVNPLEVPPMGDTNLAEVKKQYGKKLCLMGNLHTVDTMLFGDENRVRLDCLKAIVDAGDGGGFVLSTGDQCPRDTPDANVFELVNVAKEFGTYPLDMDKIMCEIERLERN